VPALVCLVLVALLCAAILRIAHMQRGVLSGEEGRMQTEWLVESGLARASARLAMDRGYQGERWEIPRSSLENAGSAVVRIRVESVEGSPQKRRLRVEAELEKSDSRRAKQTKQVIVDWNSESTGGSS
jgi:hypothetical protein